MASSYIDIHPHVISQDEQTYPRQPLFGVQSDWSKTRPVTIEQLVEVFDKGGIDKAAIVQSSTCYGFDNSYVTDSIARYPGRFTAVGSVDMVRPDALDRIRYWAARGASGLRLFTGGSTAAFDPSRLDEPASFPAWELCGEMEISICLQTDPGGLAQVAGLAKRFPKVKILLDHVGRPDVTDGPPYRKASSLFGLAPFENIYLKLTPRIFDNARSGKATAETFFPRLIDVFGSHRLAWGSNFPALETRPGESLAFAREALASVSDQDRSWIFAKTAQSIYKTLAD